MVGVGAVCFQMQGNPFGRGRRKTRAAGPRERPQRRFVCFFHFIWSPPPFFFLLIIKFLGEGWPDLIAFAWGCTRVSEAGVPEAFSPTYSGFYDGVVRLHRCYHTLRLHAYRLQKYDRVVIHSQQ